MGVAYQILSFTEIRPINRHLLMDRIPSPLGEIGARDRCKMVKSFLATLNVADLYFLHEQIFKNRISLNLLRIIICFSRWFKMRLSFSVCVYLPAV